MNFIKLIFCFTCYLFISCETSINKQNKPNDIEIAKTTSENFYRLVKAKRFKEAANYFGTTIGYQDGLHILENVNAHIGDLDTAIYVSGNSNITISKTQYEAEFVLNYKVTYTKDQANEEMVIEVINDSMKITGYHPRVKVP